MRICFTPDEEIGRGVHADLPGDLEADVAYTLDGAELGEIVYETFSADKAVVTVQGVSIHPGEAKDMLVNALHLAAKIVDTLPQVTLTPETTDGPPGLHPRLPDERQRGRGRAALHPARFRAGWAARARRVAAAGLRDGPGDRAARADHAARSRRNTATCATGWRTTCARSSWRARPAAELGIEPFSTPTRGGTDGSRLTEMGVPTPNLFTGMQNIHGPLEWISVQDMARATEMCIELAQLWGKNGQAAPK